MIASIDELFTRIEGFTNLQSPNTPELREARHVRMHWLLQGVGNPHLAIPLIHVAGSKGKGSTAAFIASGIEYSGKSCGLYVSPHISDYRERISRAGSFFPDHYYLEEGEKLLHSLETLPGEIFSGDSHPTTFELLTVLAFLVFLRAGCDWAVIETGIGGKLDATNIVEPKASVITKIELEHTEILGDTIEKIARQKGGIIKKGVPVFSSQQKQAALQVFQQISRRKEAPLYYLPDLFTISAYRTYPRHAEMDLTDTAHLLFPGESSVTCELGMLGRVQAENGALALLVLSTLGILAKPVQREDLRKLFSGTTLPGRMEFIHVDPPVFIDGAHTSESVETVCKHIHTHFRDAVVIFGALEGKRIDSMAASILNSFSTVIISRPGTFKPSDPEGVFSLFSSLAEGGEGISRIFLEAEPSRAYYLARELAVRNQLPILVTGSFYMAGEIRRLLVKR